MSFPNGPFFNFRTCDEISWFKKIIFILFGEKKTVENSVCKLTAYHFKNITYISKFELKNNNYLN